MIKYFGSVLVLVLSASVSSQSLIDVQQAQQNNKLRHKGQVKNVLRACTALTQEGDVQGRNLARNLQMEMGDSCVVQRPSVDSARLLHSQIKNAFAVLDTDKVWDEINAIAFERSMKAIWATHIKLIKNEKLSEKTATDLICDTTPLLCLRPVDKMLIKNTFSKFQNELQKKPISFLNGQEQNKLLQNEIKPLIDRTNKTCEATKKKYDEIKLAHSCVRFPELSKLNPHSTSDVREPKTIVEVKPTRPMTQVECDEQLHQAYLKHKKLEAIAEESIRLDMHLIVGSQLGSLLITDDLRKKMGILKDDFVFDRCMKGGGRILDHIWNKDLIKARSDFYYLTLSELRELQGYRSGSFFGFSKDQVLKQYLKTNPATVAELLKRNPSTETALAMCSYIKDIQDWDRAWQVVDGAVVATGVVASVALGFTGVGAPAGGVLAGIVLGSTVVSVSKSAVDYSKQVHQDSRLRSAVTTNQKNLDQALDEIKTSDERKEGHLDNIKYSLGAEFIGFGIGRGVKALSAFKVSKSLTPLTQEQKALMAKQLEGGSKTFQQEVKLLGPKGSHLTKLTIEQETELAYLYGGLDAAKTQELTKKLLGHKSQEELNNLIASLKKNDGKKPLVNSSPDQKIEVEDLNKTRKDATSNSSAPAKSSDNLNLIRKENKLISTCENISQKKIIMGELAKNVMNSPKYFLECGLHWMKEDDYFKTLKQYPDKFSKYFGPNSHRLVPNDRHAFDFSYTDVNSVCDNNYGFCRGYTVSLVRWQRLAHYDPNLAHLKGGKAPPAFKPQLKGQSYEAFHQMNEEFFNYYRPTIDAIQAGEPAIVYGYKDLREFSSNPIIKHYLKENVALTWAQQNANIFSVVSVLPKANSNMSSSELVELTKRLEFKINKLNYNPIMMVVRPQEKSWTNGEGYYHVMQAFHVTPIVNNKFSIYLQDLDFVQASKNVRRIEIDISGESPNILGDIKFAKKGQDPNAVPDMYHEFGPVSDIREVPFDDVLVGNDLRRLASFYKKNPELYVSPLQSAPAAKKQALDQIIKQAEELKMVRKRGSYVFDLKVEDVKIGSITRDKNDITVKFTYRGRHKEVIIPYEKVKDNNVKIQDSIPFKRFLVSDGYVDDLLIYD